MTRHALNCSRGITHLLSLSSIMTILIYQHLRVYVYKQLHQSRSLTQVSLCLNMCVHHIRSHTSALVTQNGGRGGQRRQQRRAPPCFRLASSFALPLWAPPRRWRRLVGAAVARRGAGSRVARASCRRARRARPSPRAAAAPFPGFAPGDVRYVICIHAMHRMSGPSLACCTERVSDMSRARESHPLPGPFGRMHGRAEP